MHVVYKMCSLIINTVSVSILDLLTVEPHTPTPEPIQYDKKDGQWYGHDGVDVKDTRERKGKRELICQGYWNELGFPSNKCVHAYIAMIISYRKYP